MITYTVEEHNDAVIVRGDGIPATMFAYLARYGEEIGLTHLDVGLCHALGALIVLTDDAGSARLRADHDAAIAHLGPLDRWLRGYDTGTSSLTMAYAMFGVRLPSRMLASRPHDPADFRRCMGLLDAVPDARQHLDLVSAQYPEWEPLIREWDSLEALCREEAPTGNCPRLYARLQELLAEAPCEGISDTKGV